MRVAHDPRVDAARMYFDLGWKIFVLGADKTPLGNCPECPKHNAIDPRTGERHNAETCECLTCHGFYAATRDLTRIEMMLEYNPSGLLAVRTGRASGIVVIDGEGYADADGLPTGVEVMDDWETWTSGANGDGWSLPDTLRQVTTQGGVHRFYRLPDNANAPEMSIRSHNRVLPGIDVKAEGGYVALPPGGNRMWLDDPRTTELAAPTAPMAMWLRAARGRGRSRRQSDSGGPRSLSGHSIVDGPQSETRGGRPPRLVPGRPIVRSGPTGVYDFEYCRENGAPVGQRDEFVNEILYRLRRSGVPRHMAEQSMRDVHRKMAQPVGDEFTWQMIMDKVEHVWSTVSTDEEERSRAAGLPAPPDTSRSHGFNTPPPPTFPRLSELDAAPRIPMPEVSDTEDISDRGYEELGGGVAFGRDRQTPGVSSPGLIPWWQAHAQQQADDAGSGGGGGVGPSGDVLDDVPVEDRLHRTSLTTPDGGGGSTQELAPMSPEDAFRAAAAGLGDAVARASAAALSGGPTGGPAPVDEDGVPTDVPETVLADVAPHLFAEQVDARGVLAASPLATLQITEMTGFDPNHPHINSDRVNGEELAAFMYGRVIATGTEKHPAWMVYDGRRWVDDQEGVYRLVVKEYSTLLRQRATSGAVTEDEGEVLMARARSLDTKSTMMAALTGFTAPMLARRLSTMDANPWLLNCPNGTLDLRTGELMPHNSLDFITRICPTPYDPDARDPVWERVIYQAMGNDINKIRVFMRFVGYTLTGDTRAKKFIVAHGATDTAKSTLTEPVYRMLGDLDDGGYATVWEAGAVQQGSGVNYAEKLAKSRAARMVLVGELANGERLRDGFVKSYTGGDTMDGRELYRSSFSFRPQGKLWLATNYIPHSTDPAVHNRMLLLPFTHAPRRKDPRVKHYLDNDMRASRAILAWAVKSLAAWQEEQSFGDTPWLAASLKSYATDSDPILQFIDEKIIDTASEGPSSSLDYTFACWKAWTHDNNIERDRLMTVRVFNKTLREMYGWTSQRRRVVNGDGSTGYATFWMGKTVV